MTSAPFGFPATLDEIVTRNRDRWQIGLATAAEMAALAGAVRAAPGEEKDLLADWRLIAIRDLHVTVSPFRVGPRCAASTARRSAPRHATHHHHPPLVRENSGLDAEGASRPLFSRNRGFPPSSATRRHPAPPPAAHGDGPASAAVTDGLQAPYSEDAGMPT